MNSKILCLIAGLTLSASLTACSSNPASNNQVAPDAGVSSTTQPGDAMSKDHPGGAMKQSPAPSKP